MEFIKVEYLNDVCIIKPDMYGDKRGYFSPFYIDKVLKENNIDFNNVVQANRSMSCKGVLRGLHFQHDPKCQGKIVEVLSGSAIDVIVDCRSDSSTYGKYGLFYLSSNNNTMLYVPKGFAHGFLSLEDNTLFQYLIDNDYSPELEDGILWNDPDLHIPWDEIFKKYEIVNPIISDKDKIRKRLCDKEINFRRNIND